MKNRRDWKAPVTTGALPLMAASKIEDTPTPTVKAERQFMLVAGSPVARGYWPYVKQVSESDLLARGLDPDDAIQRGAITEIK